MKTFNINDRVVWRETKTKGDYFKSKLGDGPFVVVAVRPAKYAGTAGNGSQEVQISGSEIWFNTAWFNKVKG